jgi:uncharacterized repeat protein (TIGR01451 family)
MSALLRKTSATLLANATIVAVIAAGILWNGSRRVQSRAALQPPEVSKDASKSRSRDRAVEAYGKLPLAFEANLGQTDGGVDFVARGVGYGMFLTSGGAALSLAGREPGRGEVVRLEFAGANQAVQVSGLEPLRGRVNYLIGADSGQWLTGIPTYARVVYKEVYPGVDLAYYGRQGRLEYDWIIAPGADPQAIRIGFAGVDRLELGTHGDLLLHTQGGTLRQIKPVIYQELDGQRQPVSGEYVLHEDGQVGFRLAAYDRTRTLVIDPVFVYDLLLGGQGGDVGIDVAVDAADNAYVTGYTSSSNFLVTAGAYQTNLRGIYDAFVTKLDSGGAVVFSTFLGGSGDEQGRGIAVDPLGNVLVTGRTDSTNFPVRRPFQRTLSGGVDAFVTKLNAAGSDLVYSTYLGGSDDEYGNPGDQLVRLGVGDIAVDSSGNAYVTASTDSNNFPTSPGAFQRESDGLNDVEDAFVTKFSPTGRLRYSTYLGGDSTDRGYGITADGAGNAFVSGETLSSNFPTTPGAFQTTYRSAQDYFVTKLNPNGSAPVYSTYLGGTGGDFAGSQIVIDAGGNAYVTGQTGSFDFPTTPGSFQPDHHGDLDATVTKLNPTGSALVFSTFLGGGDDDVGHGIGIDDAGNVVISGETSSGGGFPQVDPLEDCFSANDVWSATKFNAAGSSLIFSTCLASLGTESLGLAVRGGNTTMTGFTNGDPGATGAVVAKIADFVPGVADLAVTTVDFPDPVMEDQDLTYVVTVTNLGPDEAVDVRLDDTIPDAVTFRSATASQGSCLGTFCELGDVPSGANARVRIVVTPACTTPLPIINTATATAATTDPDSSNNTDMEETTFFDPSCQ